MANSPYRNRSGTLEQKKVKAEPKIAPSKQSMQQLMFDHVVEKINEHGLAFDTKHATCMYRTSDGKKCAVGWLISDQEYTPDMEGSQVGGLIARKILPKRLLGKFVEGRYENEILLRDMQYAHDVCAGSEDKPDFIVRMKRVAQSYKLDWNFKHLEVGQESA